jgi:zinc transport system permease protein
MMIFLQLERKIIDPFILRGLLAGMAVALVTGTVGCFVVWRRMSYFGDSLAHASLLGVALGVLIGIGANAGIVFTSLLFGFLLLWLQQSKDLPTDTLLGVLSHFALSISIIIISLNKIKIDLHSFLFGDILTVTSNDLWWMYLGGIIVLILVFLNWSSLILVTIDEDLAKAEGINPLFVNLLLTTILTIVVAISVKIIGILLITSMLIIPAAASKRLVNSPESMALLATVFGILSVILGIFLSVEIDTPSGPTIVVVSSFLFLGVTFLSLFFKKKAI